MDLDRLRLFQVVCEEGSITRAAVRMFRTQPALSMQLRTLEAEAGAQLLERTRHGVKPTAEGRRLLACCAELFRAHDRLREAWSGARGECELSIACSDTVARHFLPPVLKAFVREFPRARLHLVSSVTPEAVNRLRQGEVDVAFVLRPVQAPRLSIETVLRYRHVAVSRRAGVGRRGACQRGELARDPRALAREPLVLLRQGTQTRRFIDEAFVVKGIVPERVFDVSSVSLQKEMVRCGLGIGILPSYAIEEKDRLQAYPIVGATVREIAMAWGRDLPPTRAHQAFCSLTRAEARRHGV